MVSNALHMKLQDLLDALKRLKKSSSKDPDYQEIRRDLPKEWPM
ncbi:MAG TPA: hypothetical protein VNL14_14845 [Candidatus Acidoferrales bacterium]|nr:hypothetical protein [Candidatus Acidoferrales bacterium]